jgi:hypothetical protein
MNVYDAYFERYKRSPQAKLDQIAREKHDEELKELESLRPHGLNGTPIRRASDGSIYTQEEFEMDGCGKLPDLEIMNLDRYSGFPINGDKDLILIAQNYPNLKGINLSGQISFTVKGLEALAKNCKNLVEINIGDCAGSNRNGHFGVLWDKKGLIEFQKNHPHICIIYRSVAEAYNRPNLIEHGANCATQ